MIGRLLLRLLRAQFGWARPLGDFNVRWLGAILRPITLIKDFLNGTWLGHSLHATLTDVPVGVLTLAIILDVLDLRTAADWAIGFGILAMLGAAVSGAADYVDTDDEPRTVATIHATLMVVALVVYVVSFVLRLGTPSGDRTIAFVISLIGYLIIASAAWVGGEVVYGLGNMVNRHAWRFGPKSSWQRIDVTDIPENTPTAAKAGAQSLVLVREGTRVHALHAVCAHAGGPLAEGRIVDGCIECPWHYSRFELATGRPKQGPTTFDQPRYEVRAATGGGWEVRRVIANEDTSAQPQSGQPTSEAGAR